MNNAPHAKRKPNNRFVRKKRVHDVDRRIEISCRNGAKVVVQVEVFVTRISDGLKVRKLEGTIRGEWLQERAERTPTAETSVFGINCKMLPLHGANI